MGLLARAFIVLAAYASCSNAAVRYDERFEFAAGIPQGGATLGIATAIEGDVAVAGAYFEDGGRGAVYVYERQRGGFVVKQRLVASDRQANDRFGLYVDVDDTTIAVGAIGSQGSGGVYIFTRDAAGIWGQRQRVDVAVRGDGGPAETGDDFGAVAIDGDDLIVGVPGADAVGIITGASPKGSVPDCGAVYHFVRSSGTYALRDSFLSGNCLAGTRFGTAVDIDGNRFVASSLAGDGAAADSGTATVFTRSGPGSSFLQLPGQNIFAQDGTTGDQFGSSVRISGDTIVVGARFEDIVGPAGSNHGAAYVFRSISNNPFTQTQKLTAQSPGNNDNYGNAVAIDGTVLVIGAPYGAAGYGEVWERAGGVWFRQHRLAGRATVAGDFFGASLDLWDNTAFVGAFGRDVAGQGDAGVVHVFERDEPSGLSRQRRYTATFSGDPDLGRSDLLGTSVAIGSQWLVAGAPGVTYFNSATLSFVRGGVAYVFDRGRTTAPAVLRAAVAANDRFGEAVAISPDGDTIVVGAPEAGSGDPGEVFVFAMPPGGWAGTPFAPAPVAISVACGFRDGFARSVAVRDDGVVVVGSPLNTYGPLISVGAAYVLRPNGAGYDQFCIVAPNQAVSGRFGAEVAIEGNFIYVGAPDEARVYRYEMLASGPVLRHTLAGPTVVAGASPGAKQITGNKFGTGIDAEDDVVVVGAPLADTSAGTDSGTAYVYELTGTGIEATAELIGNKFGNGANAGTSVATNGEVVVLGAPLADTEDTPDSGVAFAFERPPGGWSGVLLEDAALEPAEGATSNQFGFDVAAADDAIVIGEPFDDGPVVAGDTRQDQGAAFEFDFTELMLEDGFE